jgi:hypothetical protein
MLWTDLGWIWEYMWLAAGCAAAPNGCGRCDRPVPVRAAQERLVNGRRALVDAREGREGVYLDFRPTGPRARRGCHPWHRRRLGSGHGAV